MEFIVAEPQDIQGLAHVFWQWGVEDQRHPRHRVDKRQAPGMQRLSIHCSHRHPAVKCIGQQRVTEPGHVNTDLMRSTCVKVATQQTGLLGLIEQMHRGAGHLARLPLQVDHSHSETVGGVAADRLLHFNRVRVAPGPARQGKVLALYIACGNHVHQGIHGGAAAGQYHEAAGVLVEPVNNACPWQRCTGRVKRKQPIEQRASPVARRRVHHQTRRLVDHPQVRVFVDRFNGHDLRHESLRLRGFTHLHGQHTAQAHFRRSLGRHTPVQTDGPLLDQLLQVTARKLWHQQRQGTVQTLPLEIWRHLHLTQLDLPCRVMVIMRGVSRVLGGRRYNQFSMNITRMLGMQCPRLSALASAFAVTMAFGLVGCSSTQKDVTAGWTNEKLYAEARDEIKSGAWDKAAGLFEKLEGRAAGTVLAQQAQIEKAYAQYRAGDKIQATATLDRFIRLHPTSPALDYAMYLKGVVNFNDNLGLFSFFTQQDLSERDQKAAKDSYEAFRLLVARFPDSKYSADARQRMTYIVNTLASYEVHVARYYASRGAHVAAINRAQQAIAEYPGVPALEEALAILVRSYDALGMTTLRDDARRVLLTNYPQTQQLTEAGSQRKGPWWKLW